MYDAFGQRTRIEYGNGVYTTYAYDDKTRRLSHLLTVENAKKRTIQEISYTYDLVGNILNTNNTAPIPGGGEHGGPTDQRFTYDDLYQLVTADGAHQLVTADGAHQPGANKRTTYNNRFAYDIIGNITWKFQNHKVLHGTDSATEPRETNYDMAYKYTGSQPHAVTDAGDKLYTYDPNGNMLGWTSKTSGQKRTIVWNEENRVKSITDGGTTTFLYNDAGERVVKRGQHGESVYINRFYSVKNGDLGSKHIFAGETRIVTKLEKDGGSLQSGVPGSIALEQSQGLQNAILQGNGQKKGIERRLTNPDGTPVTGTNPPIEKFQFFYHGDHLGSSSFITDDAGAVYQHLEYFPYGETWVEAGGSGQMPYYRFTGKELDPETGLYYYGARYYDPVLSRWISADPILGKYLPSSNNRENTNLPGYGGVFTSLNLSVYTYVHHNPLQYKDPDGLFLISQVTLSPAPAWGQPNPVKITSLNFQTTNIVKKVGGYIPIMSSFFAAVRHSDVHSSINAAAAVKSKANKSLAISLAGDAAAFARPVTTAGRLTKQAITGYSTISTIKDDVQEKLNKDGTNNALSATGWENMSSGVGYDDLDFVEAISRLYSEKYRTFSGKNRGAIGTLQFRGEEGEKEMYEMIDQARQEVMKMRGLEESPTP